MRNLRCVFLLTLSFTSYIVVAGLCELLLIDNYVRKDINKIHNLIGPSLALSHYILDCLHIFHCCVNIYSKNLDSRQGENSMGCFPLDLRLHKSFQGCSHINAKPSMNPDGSWFH